MIYDQMDKETAEEAKKSIDPIAALLLHKIMCEISREHFFAGWSMFLEFALWNILENWNPEKDVIFGVCSIHQQDIDYLRYLSDKSQGWWYVDDDGNSIFININDWREKAKSDFLIDAMDRKRNQ